MHQFETVVYQKEENIARIKLNRPHRLNALNLKMTKELLSAFEVARQDEEVRVVILQGEGRAFCSGEDLKDAPRTAHELAEVNALNQELPRLIRRLRKPVIAAVHGYALGGGLDFAVMCDIRIAAEGTKLAYLQVARGVMVETGGSFLLPRLIGLAKAKEWVLTGDMIDAAEAEKWGLVNKVVPLEELDRAATEMAKKIASYNVFSVVHSKELLDHGSEITFDAAVELERSCIDNTFTLGSFAAAMREKK